MKRSIHSSNKGFTLVELIMTITIMTVVTTIVASVLIYGYKGFYKESETMMAERYAMNAMETIINDLRRNEDVNTRVANDPANSNISTLFVKNDVKYTYDSTNDKILKNGTTIIDNSEVVVSAFTFSQASYDTKVLAISLTVTYKSYGSKSITKSYRCKLAT